MKKVVGAANSFHNFLHQPSRVLWICLIFIATSLLINGSLIRIYGLKRDGARLLAQTEQVHAQVSDIERQIKLTNDPAFIERQALDRYDLAEANDLIFVFADE